MNSVKPLTDEFGIFTDGFELCERPAVEIADLDHVVVLGLVRRHVDRLGRREGLVADVARDLLLLQVEDIRWPRGWPIRMPRSRRPVLSRSASRGEREQRRAAQRGHGPFGTIQPAPRTLRMMSLSNLRRT